MEREHGGSDRARAKKVSTRGNGEVVRAFKSAGGGGKKCSSLVSSSKCGKEGVGLVVSKVSE